MSFPRVCRGPLESVGGVESSVRNVGAPRPSWLDQVGPADHKEAGKGWHGSRITSEDSADGRAVHVGQGVTVGRSPHRTRGPARQGRSPQANLPEGHSDLSGTRECGSASHRGARCGNTARRDRCGGAPSNHGGSQWHAHATVRTPHPPGRTAACTQGGARLGCRVDRKAAGRSTLAHGRGSPRKRSRSTRPTVSPPREGRPSRRAPGGG